MFVFMQFLFFIFEFNYIFVRHLRFFSLMYFAWPTFYDQSLLILNWGGGGLQPKKNRRLPQISNLGLVFSVFFVFAFFGFSILANFDWFDGFLLSGSCWL